MCAGHAYQAEAWQAQRHRAVGVEDELVEPLLEAGFGVVPAGGPGRFGQQDEVGRGVFDHLQVLVSGQCRCFWIEFHGLRYVALQQADAQRLPGGNAPCVFPQYGAQTQQGNGDEAWHHQGQDGGRWCWRVPCQHVLQGHGSTGCDEAGDQCHEVDAAHRRKTGEGAVDLCVANTEPWKSGQHPTAGQLRQGEGTGKSEDEGPGGQVVASAKQCAQRRVQAQIGGKQHDGHRGQRCGNAAVVVHADVDPAHARAEPADAEQQPRQKPPAPQDQQGKAGEYGQLQPAIAPGGEGKGVGHAQQQGQQALYERSAGGERGKSSGSGHRRNRSGQPESRHYSRG